MNDPIHMRMLRTLKQYYGFDHFRPGQDELIAAILSGRDALGILPTGGGKSICYQIPALLFPGLTVVISPLISLMNDQIAALTMRGIRAEALHSAVPPLKRKQILQAAADGKLTLLYLAPERLESQEFLAFSRRLRISFLCVDEAHCIAAWGQEFRPSYLRIHDFIDRLPVRPVVAAFTATASPEVRLEIIRKLGLLDPFFRITGFDRKNLYYEVLHPADKMSTLLRLIRKYHDTCGVVYCRTRRSAEAVSRKLSLEGFPAACYHGALPPDVRQKNQEDFLSGRVKIICATSAFGMGIDKPDIRFVIHYNMPGDPENYYQEAGRAGRDGKPSDCIILADHRDVVIGRFFIEKTRSATLRSQMREQLRFMRIYCSGKSCLRHTMLSYFGERSPSFCGHCSVCLERSGASKQIPVGTPDPALSEDLEALRLRLARKQGVLPWKLFSDASIADLAARRPATMRDLLAIEGINYLTCIRYGAVFLDEIRAFEASMPRSHSVILPPSNAREFREARSR